METGELGAKTLHQGDQIPVSGARKGVVAGGFGRFAEILAHSGRTRI